MKKYDLYDIIILKNDKKYKANNLKIGMCGIVTHMKNDKCEVMFFNPQNYGDCALVDIDMQDMETENMKLPENIIKELSCKIDKIRNNEKHKFKPIKIRDYDDVELLVEDEKYTKYGVHKGDIGCVMDATAVKDYIQVDFSEIDENSTFYDRYISVKISDLKVVD